MNDERAYLLAGFIRPYGDDMDLKTLPSHACKYIAAEGSETKYVIYALCVVASDSEKARRTVVGYWQSVGAIVEEVHLVAESQEHKGTHWAFPDGWIRSDLVAISEEEVWHE